MGGSRETVPGRDAGGRTLRHSPGAPVPRCHMQGARNTDVHPPPALEAGGWKPGCRQGRASPGVRGGSLREPRAVLGISWSADTSFQSRLSHPVGFPVCLHVVSHKDPDVGLGLTQIRWDLDSLYPQAHTSKAGPILGVQGDVEHSGAGGGRFSTSNSLEGKQQGGLRGIVPSQGGSRHLPGLAAPGRTPAGCDFEAPRGDTATWAADGRAGGGASGEAGLRGSCFKIHQTRAICHPR